MQEIAHNSLEPRHDRPHLRLIRRGFPERPAFGTAVSEAIMLGVAAGELGPTFRLHRPHRELAFSKHDRASQGFERAVAAASAAGFPPVIRLAGGRAAAFHEGTLAFAWSTAAERPTAATHERFELAATIVAGALTRLGVVTEIGEVPGEYCPGAWSVSARGRRKLVGIGQRIVAGAAHIGGVIVVTESELLRSALVPVYAALGLEWRPETAGAVEDEVPGVTLDAVEAALIAELGMRFELVEGEIDEVTLSRAGELEGSHAVEATSTNDPAG